MKGALAGLAGVLMAGSVLAGPMDDAAAGRAALDRGHYPAAIRFLNVALASGALDPGHRELALVQRANAELAINQAARAVADADVALAINASDSAAADVLARAQASIAGRGLQGPAEASAAALNGEVKQHNDEIAAHNARSESTYQAGLVDFNARLKADADAYAAQKAAYAAELRRQDEKHAADMAAWRAKVAACQRGEARRCEQPPK